VILAVAAAAAVLAAGTPDVVVATDHLALVRGGSCLVPLRDGVRGAPVCKPTKPLTVFTQRSGAGTSLVGVLGPGVTGVVAQWTVQGRPQLANQELHGTARLLAFGGWFRGRTVTLIAFDRVGDRVARLTVH
jgi:hypothetical protein